MATISDSIGATFSMFFSIPTLSITANNDTITIHSDSNTVITSSTSVLSNDQFYERPILPSSLSQITLSPLEIPTGFTINNNGSLSVLPGITTGTYSLTYQICSVYDSNLCKCFIIYFS